MRFNLGRGTPKECLRNQNFMATPSLKQGWELMK